MVFVVGGFGAIAIVGYMSPIVELSQLDGRCRIGLPPRVSFPLLSFDVGINFLLTGVFFWLLRPALSCQGLSPMSGICGNRIMQAILRHVRKRQDSNTDSDSRLTAMNRSIKTLLWKSLIGSTCIMFPTVANMAQFYIMKGRELGWICLTICTLDGMHPVPFHSSQSLIPTLDIGTNSSDSELGCRRNKLAHHRVRRSREKPH